MYVLGIRIIYARFFQILETLRGYNFYHKLTNFDWLPGTAGSAHFWRNLLGITEFKFLIG
jgi:hypothetical protein